MTVLVLLTFALESYGGQCEVERLCDFGCACTMMVSRHLLAGTFLSISAKAASQHSNFIKTSSCSTRQAMQKSF